MLLIFLASNRCPLIFHLLLSRFALNVGFGKLTNLDVEISQESSRAERRMKSRLGQGFCFKSSQLLDPDGFTNKPYSCTLVQERFCTVSQG
jgi:hypothetical protein